MRPIYRTVLDSNVYVSAFGFGGKPKELIRHGIIGHYQIVLSDFIIKETSQVCLKKLGLPKKTINGFFEDIIDFVELVTPTTPVSAVENDGDNQILSIAFDGRANFIVTGDKSHLLPLKTFKGIKIITISDFFTFLERGSF